MWRRIRILAIILSVSLNVAFVVVWATRAVSTHSKSCDPAMCMNDSTGKIWCPLHRALGTTDEEWRTLEPMQRQYRAESQAVCREVSGLRAEMIDLLAKPDANRDSIRVKQDQIIDAQRKMQDLTIEHLLSEKQVLSAAQQAKLFSMMKRGDGCAAQGTMMGLGHGQGRCAMEKDQTGNKQ
jgi:Spy/CpxP family protein refolding chaperone